MNLIVELNYRYNMSVFIYRFKEFLFYNCFYINSIRKVIIYIYDINIYIYTGMSF